MIYGLFSIYDSKAEAYLPPFVLPKTQMAQRVFSDCANSADHQFGQNPADYNLFHLGHWDDENAQYTAFTAPVSLGLALEYVKADTPVGQMDLIEATEGRSNGEDSSKQPLTSDAPIRQDSTSDDPT